MPFMTLVDPLRIGIAAIDEQHGELLATLKKFQAEVDGYRRPQVKKLLLDQLAQQTAAHFLSEEAMMAEAHYPGLPLHVLKHEHLFEKLNALRARYSGKKPRLGRHTLNFLLDWLVTHIQTDDTNFALWLHEVGKH